MGLVIYYHIFQHLYQFSYYSCKSSWIFLDCFYWYDFYWFCFTVKSCEFIGVFKFFFKLYCGWFPLVNRALHLPVLKDCLCGNWFFSLNLWYCHRERASRCQCWWSVVSQAFLHVKSSVQFENDAVNSNTLSPLWSNYSFIFQHCFFFLCFICFLITYSLLYLALRIRIVA